ncbi:hypothetical protein DV738_g5397, partial [Chaetothyriales sp. CBS 135597]
MAPLAGLDTLRPIGDLDTATEQDLRQIIQTFPIIDNHAHNLLEEDHAHGSPEHPFESITSEAQGSALADHVHTTLPHVRAIKQLAELYRCPPTLVDVKASRYEWVRRDYPGLVRKCLEGSHAILMDDGLPPKGVNPFKWHRQFLPTVLRIVRIEQIAADLLSQLVIAAGFLKVGVDADWDVNQTESFLVRFNTAFRNQIRTLANDPDVRGFKSVVCYRSGLDIGLDSSKNFRPHQSLTDSSLLTAFHEFIQKAVRDNNYRVQQKEVNDFLVVATCDVLTKLVAANGESLPFQFHTGLGDNDLDLIKANPAYLQPLIAAFPQVDFVLLHSSYPYTRQAGYLAANYPNVWLDIGEVFPMLSRNGEEAVLRQALELTPTSKILWSTDGHFYPETYYLANRQFRDALTNVLTAYVAQDDLTIAQAVDIAVDIMFWNSNSLYRLDEERKYPELLRACGRVTGGSLRTLVNGLSDTGSFPSSASTRVEAAGSYSTRPAVSVHPSSDPTSWPRQVTAGSASESGIAATLVQEAAPFEAFLKANPEVKYIWYQFCDYTGTLRQRMVPVAQFRKQITKGKYQRLPMALTRLLQDDTPSSFGATGESLAVPDLSTLSLNKGIESPSATVQSWLMLDTPGGPPREHWDCCPRWLLQRQVDALKSEFNIDILLGFEVEVVFMRPIIIEGSSDFIGFEPPQLVHSWSNMTYQQLDMLPIIEEIVDTLADLGIHLTQFHSEAAPSQWEFPLPAYEALKSVDVLYKTKDVIRNVAKKHGLKATAYPRPYNFTCGTANHAHISLNGPGVVEAHGESFSAGILEHLPALLALTLPLDESYERVKPGIWAGGEYVCWGTLNKEVPLRLCEPGHWELKSVDGIGNMYLSMAAVLASGLHGIRERLPLTIKDCTGDPTALGEEGRARLGITTKLPNSLDDSLAHLKRDRVLWEMLGESALVDYINIKEAEMAKLRGFGDVKRRAEGKSSEDDEVRRREVEVGIIHYVNPTPLKITGLFKSRYTDFLVNEIDLEGNTLHLTSLEHVADSAPAPAPATGEADKSVPIVDAQPPDEDIAKLNSHFDPAVVKEILSLYESILSKPKAKPKDHPVVQTPFTTDRTVRAQIHADVRRIFKSRIDSQTDHSGTLVLSASPVAAGAGAANRHTERGGEHLHFNLYKENKDSMEMINLLARRLKTNSKAFRIAGTKDRRAATVQRVSAYRIDASRLAGLNSFLRAAALGDFEYKTTGLDLGDLSGNEFVIALREFGITAPPTSSDQVQRDLDQEGIQRRHLAERVASLRENGWINYFGLQRFGSFAIRSDVTGLKILQGDFQGAFGTDDLARAAAIAAWRKTHRLNDALDKMPKRFAGESAVIRHLSRSPTDHLGALLAIPRTQRTLYVHAYQSRVWNLAASNRWALWRRADDVFDRARPLTAAEAADNATTGRFSIFDIVLPTPGWDVEYPANASGDFYAEFMATDDGGRLDPRDMRRKHRDFSLSGSSDDAQIRWYTRDDEPLLLTDLERLHSAQYATMALRELSQGGVREYKPHFSGGR